MIYHPKDRETDLCGVSKARKIRKNTNERTAVGLSVFDSPQLKEDKKMATVTFRTDWCKGCGVCVDACPKGCLTIAADKINKKGYSPAVMVHEDKCIGCAFCATMCPDCIITVEK